MSVFSFAQKDDLFVAEKELPKINDLAARQRKVQFSLLAFTQLKCGISPTENAACCVNASKSVYKRFA